MLAVVLPVILLEIIVCLLYVGRWTACHSVRDHCLSFVCWPLNCLSFCYVGRWLPDSLELFVFFMLAVELPVILLEIIVFLLYVGRWTACHSVRDHYFSFVCWPLNCLILLEINVCLLYVGRWTVCHSVRDRCLSLYVGRWTACHSVRDRCLSFLCWPLNCLSFC